MKKITDFNEFMSLWNISHKNRYWGNKKITQEQEQEIIKKHDIEDFKRYNIYLLEDNYHFIVIDTKWAIDKTLYYDDEMPDPGKSFEIFKHYNEMNRQYYKLEKCDNMQPYYIRNYNGNDREVVIQRYKYYSDYTNNLQWAKDKNYFYRLMTEEEIQKYNNIVEELNKLYDERLEKYYKKFNKNIYTMGYWVNR